MRPSGRPVRETITNVRGTLVAMGVASEKAWDEHELEINRFLASQLRIIYNLGAAATVLSADTEALRRCQDALADANLKIRAERLEVRDATRELNEKKRELREALSRVRELQMKLQTKEGEKRR